MKPTLGAVSEARIKTEQVARAQPGGEAAAVNGLGQKAVPMRRHTDSMP